MKKVRNFALLMLLGFSLSGYVNLFPLVVGCAALMNEVSEYTHKNMPIKEFIVSVRTCDEKTHQAYQEVLQEMGYKLDRSWVRLHEGASLYSGSSIERKREVLEKLRY